jgi:hypothetical protein
MQAHLRQDLADAHAAGLLAVSRVELAARIVTAISRQAAQDLADGRIDETALPDIVRAILRAVGCTPRDAAVRADQAARNAEAFSRAVAASVRKPS